MLPAEVIHWLDPQPGQIIVDATLGAGGHTRLIAEKISPSGRVISLDCDPSMIEATKKRITNSIITFVHASFDQLRQVLDELKIQTVDGVLADLGICSDQLDDSQRGLSFQREGPLDMRLDPTRGMPASALVAQLDERSLADIIFQLGEERLSRRIAKAIVLQRKVSPIRTTTDLAELVRRCVPRSGKIDPATRTFQAFRIAVNCEMESLDSFLKMLPSCLKPGGRVVIISFHSLEDRKVKAAFRDSSIFV
ncbi:16S rRNA (cytosine(1402)-N(4))-methyltransferase RsmH, partial [bacterium]|nr:16S rRNA (cytosine(1402)-N(4))-methyltransferase RsmH [bacterium]